MNRVNIERILCPIDFSEFSRHALDHALALARWYGASLSLMHVIDIPQVPLDGLAAGAETFAPLLDRDRVAEDLRNFAGPILAAADVRTDVLITYGVPSMTIQLQAERMRADLIVVGTHGRSGFQRFLLGSVTERLLRSVAIPLLTVPPPARKAETVKYDTILCPVDFSDESMRARDYALSLAQESDARLILLHVLEGVLDDVEPRLLGSVNVPEYLRQAEDDAMARLRAAVPEQARVWSHPVERVARGRAYRRILAIAGEEHAALIVMGVRGKGALNRLIFGSTTEHVLREAPCPVLTIHAGVALERTSADASAGRDSAGV